MSAYVCFPCTAKATASLSIFQCPESDVSATSLGRRFVSRVNMGCVNQKTGEIDPRKLPILHTWHRGLSIEAVLKDLRREMASPHNRMLPQPSEGSTYENVWH